MLLSDKGMENQNRKTKRILGLLAFPAIALCGAGAFTGCQTTETRQPGLYQPAEPQAPADRQAPSDAPPPQQAPPPGDQGW